MNNSCYVWFHVTEKPKYFTYCPCVYLNFSPIFLTNERYRMSEEEFRLMESNPVHPVRHFLFKRIVQEE